MAHILMVEDDLDFQQSLSCLLQSNQHEVSLVETAEEALDAVGRTPFDLLIVDLMLPGMDGAELTRRLRQEKALQSLPVLVLTSAGERLGMNFGEDDATWLPADKVLDKVTEPSVLARVVEEMVALKPGSPRRRRVSEQSSLRHVATTCPYCGVGCGMYLKVRQNQLLGVVPSQSHQVSRGRLCVKGWTAHEPIMHTDRLKQPLVRHNGVLEPASWEEALEVCGRKFAAIKARHGSDALGIFSSSCCTNEENFLAQKLARAVFGTNNVDQCASACHSPTVAGLLRSFGSGAMTNSIEELASTSCLFVIGSNVTETHPVIGWRVRRAKDSGATLMVADPRQTEVAQWADIHLQHMPGTDIALLNSMAWVMISEGLYDKDFVRERSEGLDNLWDVVQQYRPQVAGEICGLAPRMIQEAARRYALSKSAAIVYTLGITEHTIGTDDVMAVANLAILTGNLGKPCCGVNLLHEQNNVQGGCDMGALPDQLPGYQPVADPTVRAKFEQAWQVALPGKPGLTATDMLQSAACGDIRGLYIIGEDPLRSDPNSSGVEAALKNLDFLVCQDIFLNETCRLADVVLPAASFAEKDGTFTNTERRVQRVRQAISPVGSAWPDWQIICALSQRLNYPMHYNQPSEIMEEIARLTPIYGGVSYDRLETHGLQWPCPDSSHSGTPFLHAGFFTRGRAILKPVTHRPPAEVADEQFPLMLSTGRTLFHNNVGTMARRSEFLQREQPANFCMIHPQDATAYGATAGRQIRVVTRRGSVLATAEVTERIRRGVIWMPFHFAESPTNALTNDAFCPTFRTGDYKACAARVEALETI